MTHSLTVVGWEPVDLDGIANQLRQEIDALPAGSPPDKLLAAKFLNQQTGVQTYLVVVRGNEDPHTHPDQFERRVSSHLLDKRSAANPRTSGTGNLVRCAGCGLSGGKSILRAFQFVLFNEVMCVSAQTHASFG